jgi:F-type H+-transporting ATPase subunit alpha
MNIKGTDLVSLFADELAGKTAAGLEKIGVVLQIGDNICTIGGLQEAIYGEVVEFDGGNKGIILNLEESMVSAFLLYNHIPVKEREVVRKTGHVFRMPVGPQLLGRVINAIGEPIDALGALNTTKYRETDGIVPGVIDRSPIDESFETGCVVVDCLVPIGRGQRELIVGNRATGKTALAIDAILHQKGKGVYCIYVAIGQRQAQVARLAKMLSEYGAMEYTTIISASTASPVLNQYLAPYAGCTIAEEFRDNGHDVLIVYDDLTNHAVAYREISLLLKRSPGREAYPGDVFYLHSRLLERAGKLLSGASITALPIAQIQSDDITAYIPTNLISITDGQIFLDTKLFNQGLRPAVNIGLSVSRVGGAAQTKAIKQVIKALRLDLAQYNDLLEFSQFGTELDELSQQQLKKGEIVIEILRQPQHVTYNFVDQSLMFFLFKNNLLEALSLDDVRDYAVQFASYVKSVYPDNYQELQHLQKFTDENYNQLLVIAGEFSKLFVSRKN